MALLRGLVAVIIARCTQSLQDDLALISASEHLAITLAQSRHDLAARDGVLETLWTTCLEHVCDHFTKHESLKYLPLPPLLATC